MAGTRISPRNASKAKSSPNGNDDTKSNTGDKRKADTTSGSSPTSKRGKKDIVEKDQKTLEEILPNADGQDTDMKEESPATSEAGIKTNDVDDKSKTEPAEANGEQVAEEDAKNKDTAVDNKPSDAQESEEKKDDAAVTASKDDGAIEEDPGKDLPSNTLEKGIIYFFTRGRVGVDDPDSVSDIARSYIVLRPLPDNAKLGDGPIQDLGNNRLLAVPKKVLPKSHQDRFMVFVEKAKTTIADLKENFFAGSTYETKTSGVRSAPPVTPLGEGVYAFTTEGRNTHLAYMLTVPSEIGQVQKDMGVRKKASFLTSLKNPTVKGPANAALAQAPDFPKEIIDAFSGRAWMPVSNTEQLDYANAQFLLIGEGEQGFAKAVETAANGDGVNEEAKQEIEELEHQDQIRVEHLHGDSTIFDDLDLSKKEYPDVLTTW